MLRRITAPVLAITAATMFAGVSSAEEVGLYDDDGNVILDLQQESNQDYTEEVILDKEEVVLDEEEVILDEVVPPLDPILYDEEPSQEEQDLLASFSRIASVSPMFAPFSYIQPGYMYSHDRTYLANKSNPSPTYSGSKDISTVTPIQGRNVNLPGPTVIVQGSTITFNTTILDDAVEGDYAYTVKFIDGSTDTITLAITRDKQKPHMWSVNSTTISNVEGNIGFGDVVLTSTQEGLRVTTIKINNVVVNPSNYTVVGSNVIISGSYLTSLPELDFTDVVVFYNEGRHANVILSVEEGEPQPEADVVLDCPVDEGWLQG